MKTKTSAKARLLSWVTAAALALSMLPAGALAADFGFSGKGSGTAKDPYMITNQSQLEEVNNDRAAYYKLGNDLTLTGTWVPIGGFINSKGDGETPDEDAAFSGVFDGGGKTISNLTVGSAGSPAVMCGGLFAVVASGTVKNLQISGATVYGNAMAAAAIGYAYDSTVDNVDVVDDGNADTGTTINGVVVKSQNAAGKPVDAAPNMLAAVVGAGMDSTMIGCDVADTTITVETVANTNTDQDTYGSNAHDIGLVGGGLEDTNLDTCNAAGTISIGARVAGDDYVFGVGGLSGCAMSAKSVTNCSADATINIQGDKTCLVGGLLGYTGTGGDDAPSQITKCNAQGSITVGTNSERVGKLLGGGFYNAAYAAFFPVPARFAVDGASSAGTGGASNLVGFVTELDTVGGRPGNERIFAGGTGKAGAPYQIENAAALYAMRYDLAASYQLNTNINVGETFDVPGMDMNGDGDTNDPEDVYHGWSAVGSYVMLPGGEDADPDHAFTGTFDGAGFTVSNITLDTSSTEDDITMADPSKYGTFGTGGLFNCVAKNGADTGIVKEVTVSGVNVKGYALVSGAVGYADHATLTNVKSVGTSAAPNKIECTAMMAGGVVGGCMEATITGCEAEYTDVTAGAGGNSGAMGGGLSHATVTDCTVDHCKVTAAQGGAWIGGLSGCMNFGDADVTTHAFKNCSVSNTTITVGKKASYVGGLTGAGGNIINTAAQKRAVIDTCTITNVDITLSDSTVTNVGGLIGGGLTDTAGGCTVPNSFAVKDCTVDDKSSITVPSGTKLADNGIGTLIGEAYLCQIVKSDTASAITTTAPELAGTGTSSALELTGAATVGKVRGASAADEFAGGIGTANDPYLIATAAQLNNVRNHLSAYFKLTDSIDLQNDKNWEPIGTMSAPFTGGFDGNSKTISNITVNAQPVKVDTDNDGVSDSEMIIAGGLFNYTYGQNCVVKDLTVKDVSVTVDPKLIDSDGLNDDDHGSMSTGGVIGYAMGGGKVSGVIVTSDTKRNTISGSNCVGGVIGGGYNVATSGCKTEKTDIKLLGDNHFTNARIVQYDMAECGGGLIGGGFGGSMTGNTVSDVTITAMGNEPVGLGGLSGSAQCMTAITDNTVTGTTITTEKGGHAIGGLCAYTGTGTDGNGVRTAPAAPTSVTGNTVAITIKAPGATHVGGLIGTVMYYFGMENLFTTSGNAVTGTITAGTDDTSVYGTSTPGAIAGRAVGCTIAETDFSGLTINNKAAADAVGATSCLYESADQYDKDDAAAQLNALFDTYRQLFEGTTFDDACDAYWHDAAAAVVGEAGADAAVKMMKTSIGGKQYGANKEDNVFCCGFINGVDQITFNGTEISGTLNGKKVFSHPYKVIGQMGIGAEEGVPGFSGMLLQSLDNNSGQFTYFLMMPDTMDDTYHIEFRYGNSSSDLALYGKGPYANWLAAGISTSAMSESSTDPGKKDNTLRQVISLFSEENLGYDQTTGKLVHSEAALAQAADLVGTWDADPATITALETETGIQNLKMYCELKADGTGSTYLDMGTGSYVKTATYDFFAYDNDGSADTKSGMYIADDGERVASSPYAIGTSGGTLSFYAEDGTATYVKRTSSSGGSGSSGSHSSGSSGSASSTGKAQVNTPTNGQITANSNGTVSIVPDTGYQVADVTVNGVSKGAVTSLSDLKSTDKVVVTFEKATTSSAGFSDVDANAYYADAVAWAVEKGVTTGTTDTTFAPDASCTRAQMLTFLWRAAGSPEPTSTGIAFTDVPADAYYAKAVAWAVGKGITNGVTSTTFGSDETVTRGQSIVFQWRNAGSPAAAASTFSDVSADDYYANAVAWAVEQSITNGTSATTFSPQSNCTRGQIATFLYNNLGK